MLATIQKLIGLLNTVGSLGSLPIGAYVEVIRQVLAAIQNVGDAKTAEDYHTLAANVLRPIVALTTNPFDNGALIAIEALGRDQAWLDWSNAQLAETSFVDALVPPGIPDDALVLRQVVEIDIPEDAQAFGVGSVIGGLAALDKIRQLWPVFLAVIELLRTINGTPKPAEA